MSSIPSANKQSCTSSSRGHSRSVAAVVTAIFFSVLLSANVSAQCPTGWLGPVVSVVNVGGCAYTVTACYPGPNVFPQEQYRITSITSDSGCALTGSTMREISRKLIEANPGNFLCDSANCPHRFTSFTVSRATCWKQTGNTYDECGSADQGCADIFEVCCQCPNTLTAFYKGGQTSDQCQSGSDPACVTICANVGTPEETVCPDTTPAPRAVDPLK